MLNVLVGEEEERFQTAFEGRERERGYCLWDWKEVSSRWLGQRTLMCGVPYVIILTRGKSRGRDQLSADAVGQEH